MTSFVQKIPMQNKWCLETNLAWALRVNSVSCKSIRRSEEVDWKQMQRLKTGKLRPCWTFPNCQQCLNSLVFLLASIWTKTDPLVRSHPFSLNWKEIACWICGKWHDSERPYKLLTSGPKKWSFLKSIASLVLVFWICTAVKLHSPLMIPARRAISSQMKAWLLDAAASRAFSKLSK